MPCRSTGQSRPLASHYPIIWLDAIHYMVKQDGRYASKAVYTVLGLNLKGKKDILGLYPLYDRA